MKNGPTDIEITIEMEDQNNIMFSSNATMDLEIEKHSLSIWQSLPDDIIIKILYYLPASSLLKVAQVCKTYHRLAFDEILWKDLFYSHWKVDRSIPMSPGKVSWVQEYKRMYYHTPAVESEVVLSHTDEVLHVSFAHNGKMFATSSKDGFIKVWDTNSYPCLLKNQADMSRLKWKCTFVSEFNESDTLLLVSGSLSSDFDGEIVIFSLQGDFEMLSQVTNTPYDVRGTWYNDCFLSASLNQTGHGGSYSDIWLRKATQKAEFEQEPLIKHLFRFRNENYNWVRFLLIANVFRESSNTLDKAFTRINQTGGSHPNQLEDKQSMLTLSMLDEKSRAIKDARESSDNVSQICNEISDQEEKKPSYSSSVNADETLDFKSVTSETVEKLASLCFSGDIALQTRQFGSSNDGLSSTTNSTDQNVKNERIIAKVSANNAMSIGSSTSSNNLPDKYLIFICGLERCADHIGIKRFRAQEYFDATTGQLLPNVSDIFHSSDGDAFDSIDHIFDMHGQIIGMCLSPDHRYLYVNSRPWQDDYQINDSNQLPPLSEEIDLHVFDLLQVKMIGKLDTSHKAYTPIDNCFYVYLDVCEDYVASGAEDKHGYIWDRHYGICLKKFPHSAAVCSVAFNPVDPEMLVTASDDFSIKVWRSRNSENNLIKTNTQLKQCGKRETNQNISKSVVNTAAIQDKKGEDAGRDEKCLREAAVDKE